MASQSIRVYVSYSWAVEEETRIVEKLGELCATREIEFVRDETELKHGELISEFMAELSRADHVITVFSRKYFESEYCMYELLTIYHRGDFQGRVHPVIVDEMVLSDIDTQIEYINFWKNEVETTKDKLSKLNRTKSIPLTERLKIFEDIHGEINKIMSFTGNMNITPLAKLKKEEYSSLLDRIKPIADKQRPDEELPKTYVDQYFLNDLVDKITISLGCSEVLRTCLNKKYCLSIESEAKDLAEELIAQCEVKITSLIRSIAVITRDQLEKLENEKSYEKAIQLIDHAEKLVALFSLFDIKAEQAEKLLALPLNMTLPHEAPGSAELALSVKLNSFPKYRVSKSSPEIFGKFAVLSSELEPGIKNSSVVDFYEKRIWKLAFPNYSTDKFDLDRLRERIGRELDADDRNKKNYHIVVTLNKFDDEKNPLADDKVRNELNNRFDGLLPIIVLKNADKTGLYVSSDRELMEEIYNFYDQIGPYQARMQEHA